MFTTPILLITFNRPNHTKQVWNEIKKQKPKQVFVFQDGARNDDDLEKINAVRALFEEQLDWDCELKTYFSDINLGCGLGPSTALNWFFENVDEGLIFEDDAVPAQDFFLYAQELLTKYRDVDKVKVIGSMHIDGRQYGDYSYHFSMSNRSLCAWATWKRTWDKFDYTLSNVSNKELRKALKNYKLTYKEIDYWIERLEEIHKDCLNNSSWDMQFLMSIWLNNGVGIFPNMNLSTNVGFDLEATHTTSSENIAANIAVGSILPLSHPNEIKISRKADLNYHKLYFQPWNYGISGIKLIPFQINKKIKKFLKVEGSWKKIIWGKK